MDRVYLPSALLVDGRFVVEGASRRHLADALRVRPGDRFLATDGEGFEYLLEAETVTRRELTAHVRERNERPPGPGARLTLAIAPPRGRRMDTAVEKAVECGVGRIVPLLTEHSVLRAEADSERLERWRRIAQSATAQSGRVRNPPVEGPLSFAEALALPGATLLAHPGPESTTIAAAVTALPPDEAVTLLVGPEGGFSTGEVDQARRGAAIAVSLGPNRLRSETAAIVAVALAMAALGEA
ncbi:16S rRNA (uracil(1498)-N(3))-methyltransferase [bacterium]|nr:16S rRNA (uracil(1498)-N(3))-methyltransferase [bacterium]